MDVDVMDVVDLMDVMDTPTNPMLPQTNEYSRPQFYVRGCYDEYYRQVKELLNKYEYVSITGTKGI
jgi:hypothetical protein